MRKLVSDTHPIVAKVLARAKHLAVLEDALRGALDEELVTHCQIAQFNQGVLSLVTDSPAWGTKLNYLVPKLLADLRQVAGLSHLRSIKVLVRP